MRPGDDVRDRLERSLRPVSVPPASLEDVARRAGRHKRRRYLASGALGAVVAIAVLVPLGLLSRLGRPHVDTSVPQESATTSPFSDRGADQARIVCDVSRDGTTTRLLTPVVSAHPDGVHISVENRSRVRLQLRIEYLGGAEGGGVPVGIQTFIRSIAPGEARIGCVPRDAPPTPLPTLKIVDPSDLWVSPDLECTGGKILEVIPEYATGTPGEDGMPFDVARRHLPLSPRPGDDIRNAGYPKSQGPFPLVAVVRGDRTIATVTLTPGSGGGWLVGISAVCSNEVGSAAQE